MNVITLQIIPARHDLFAVLADEHGKAVFKRVHCQAIISHGLSEANGYDDRRVVGFATGEHLFPYDWNADFLGYADSKDEPGWDEKAKLRRKELDKAALEAKSQKLIIPESKVVNPAQFNRN